MVNLIFESICILMEGNHGNWIIYISIYYSLQRPRPSPRHRSRSSTTLTLRPASTRRSAARRAACRSGSPPPSSAPPSPSPEVSCSSASSCRFVGLHSVLCSFHSAHAILRRLQKLHHLKEGTYRDRLTSIQQVA